MKILVVGAAGQLGQAMVPRLSSAHTVTTLTRRDVDITDHETLRRLAIASQADVIVNCAAFNMVDAAEDDFRAAIDINAMAVRTLARAAETLDATLMHFSTDFVFDGKATQPYRETDVPEPKSVYGQSKLVGEWMAAGWHKHYVFRVESLFGGPHTRSSVDRIVDGVRAGTETPVFHDRFVSPSFVDDVAGASQQAIERRIPYGLYHCVNTGLGSWLDVARTIAGLVGNGDRMLKPISVNDLKLRAARPAYAALSNQKLQDSGIAMPTWQDALERYLNRRSAAS
jgi:dTDP-4-dehydrorhamnose reductase